MNPNGIQDAAIAQGISEICTPNGVRWKMILVLRGDFDEPSVGSTASSPFQRGGDGGGADQRGSVVSGAAVSGMILSK